MVMKRNIMVKNLFLSIVKSIGRYLAIIAIVALGAGLFIGLIASKIDIVETANRFVTDQNMFDFRILNNYGWTDASVDAVNDMDGISLAEGLNTLDVIGRLGDNSEDIVYQLYSLPEKVNQPLLLGGRMPESDNECLLDGFAVTDQVLGAKFYISQQNDEDVFDSLSITEYTVVGYVSTPLFMDMTRGTTTLGNGTVTAYLYVPKAAFTTEYYSEISLRVDTTQDAYTDAYTDEMEQFQKQLEPRFEELAQSRYEAVCGEAMAEYTDGYQEYLDGVKEYEEAVVEVNQELADAERELLDAEKEIADNKAKIRDGEKKIEDGWKKIEKSEKKIRDGRSKLDKEKKKAYDQLETAEKELDKNKKTVKENLKLVKDGISQINQGLQQLNDGIASLEAGLAELSKNLTELKTQRDTLTGQIEQGQSALEMLILSGTPQEQIDALSADLETARINFTQLSATIEALEQQYVQYDAQRQQLYSQKEELQKELSKLKGNQKELEKAQDSIANGYDELKKSKKKADIEFVKAEKELSDCQAQITSAKKTLEKESNKLKDAKEKLSDAEKKLADGWVEYYDGKAEAEAELADAKKELEDASLELEDAKKEIDDLPESELYMLDRNTNVGYLAVESNAQIVAGVSRVFPVFFVLVAALVCITTMTRMVAEERTQIGTLKALGYINAAIIAKYIVYSGSAAVIGCGIGVCLGMFFFPEVIWFAYKIMLNIKPELNIVFDIPLCIAVTSVYTLALIAVTWYCCHTSLREEPAELIRPKAPTSGKKIWLEYLPFWKRIRFLNKVMLRNIFRYRQRLLMMLVGIGGCTALLVTGFGVGDSILDIVSYQFQEVTLYDLQIQFSEPQSPLDKILVKKELGDSAEAIAFVHQSSVDITFGDQTKNINMIIPSNDLEGFFDFHVGTEKLSMPQKGEALISVGTAQALDIETGDTITLRNADLQQIEVKVAAVFDNNVYNYVILSSETYRANWGETPEYQMAFVVVPPDVDPHVTGALAASMDEVMNVLVSQDLADQVGAMLDALTLIIFVIVVAAGLLAIIVTYNLTNINITERIREIATIKVLGFRAGESAAYVFKENLVLSAMGAILGLGLGKGLLRFVMSQIVIDMVWFQDRVTNKSLLLSVVITILMACVVDFLLYFKLEKINMAEALKSVE